MCTCAQAQHCLVLDMITRADYVWPRYGTANGYEQPGIGANGFQDIFAASMMGALEWGALYIPLHPFTSPYIPLQPLTSPSPPR